MINLVYVNISGHRRNSLIQQQINKFTWYGWSSILAGNPPTIRPFGLGFAMLEGTPEIFTDIYIINPTGGHAQ